jgi:hypothetical protein
MPTNLPVSRGGTAVGATGGVNGQPTALDDRRAVVRKGLLLQGEMSLGDVRWLKQLDDILRPRNDLETMMVTQMFQTHTLVVSMLRRTLETDRVDFTNAYGNLAVKLLRAFNAQMETLARLRGQTGQQTVRVEHVTVEAGGQAVVGAVTTGGTGDDQ